MISRLGEAMDLREKLWRFENDPNWTALNLPIDPDSENCEEVLVERKGDNSFRVASSPGFVEGIAADDVIALDSTNALGYRILSRGNNISIRFCCEKSDVEEAKRFFDEWFGRIGGWLDATMGDGGLTYTIPLSAGFGTIEDQIKKAASRFPNSTWWYGNIYDPVDGVTPLNWWLEEPK